MQTNHHQSYSIGVVARRANIHPETLRVWEKRYAMVTPLRTESGRRMYSDSDILKLSLVKQLTELGHPVSDVADLSIDDLRERLNGERSAESLASTGIASRCRVVFSSPDLRIRFGADLLKFSDMAVAEPFDADVTAANDDGGGYADVLVSEMSTIDQDSAEQVQQDMKRAGCASAIVIFSFGTRQAVAQVSNAGIIFLKGPVAAGDIRRACMALGLSPQKPKPRPELPPRKFTASQLMKVAGMGGSIACECPNHLAEMITSLCAFEKYSRECANRNDEDARVHAQLEASTAQARSILEESLARLIEIEGILV
jgi:DNA-binding transcriptional MerR regulator